RRGHLEMGDPFGFPHTPSFALEADTLSLPRTPSFALEADTLSLARALSLACTPSTCLATERICSRTASTTVALRIRPATSRWATGRTSIVVCPPGIQR